jgi:hypothetical protein
MTMNDCLDYTVVSRFSSSPSNGRAIVFVVVVGVVGTPVVDGVAASSINTPSRISGS